MKEIFPDLEWYKVHSIFEFPDLFDKIKKECLDNCKVIHCFSNYIISDPQEASLSFQKLPYVNDNYAILYASKVVGAMFSDVTSYITFMEKISVSSKAWDMMKSMDKHFEIEGMVDISTIDNFIQCITGNFDSRYFNSLNGNEYRIVKSSTNIKKIKAEYSFYHLLPEDMKYWFVMPFNYKETATEASYTMERLYMTDLAIKWVHGSMDEEEFSELMDKYFYFFSCRHKKKCSEEEYQMVSKKLYIDKVRERIDELKHISEFQQINRALSISPEIHIDRLLEKYLELKNKIESKVKQENILVIGHGDPCFANALYNKSTKTLKFIDPKGVLCEEELWTNPYYDIAKLSHSVCGRYDFFNNAMYDIRINEDFTFDVDIPFDNQKFVTIFKNKVEENGFNYLLVRIYEASLFLSMLPLHKDNPHKVFGFILNVKKILGEIEKDV